ncbi:257_t:CDS:2 [Paraglomus occultum]|uniref:sphingomyelin phosphodiesterase n=1 Tax=Paraglomus occultum TaxID=144539 RepID=A0A9N9AC43_9GLOM|nr:257_t:CDS:2 [Paraglomus occultum]
MAQERPQTPTSPTNIAAPILSPTITQTPLSSTNADNSTTKVKLLSLNIFLQPLMTNTPYKADRMNYFITNILPNYDIVCLQEMYGFGSGRRQKLINAAGENGFGYVLKSKNKLTRGMIDGGLLILSRFPITDSEEMIFGCQGDRFVPKGSLYAKIAVKPTCPIHLFVTQLQSSCDPHPSLSDTNVRIRFQQVHQLRQFVDRCKAIYEFKPNEMVMVVGDLNVDGRRTDEDDDGMSEKNSREYFLMQKILSGKGIPANYANPRFSIAGLRYSSSAQFSIRDVLKETYSEHPITYAGLANKNGSPQSRESVLKAKQRLGKQCSLDYIFVLESRDEAEKEEDDTVEIDIKNTKVEEFSTDGSFEFSQISGKCWSGFPASVF